MGPETETLDITDEHTQLGELVRRVGQRRRRVLVETRGVPVAAIVSADDLKTLERVDREQREAHAVLNAMRAPFRDVPHEEIDREAEKAIKAARSRAAVTDELAGSQTS